MRKTIYLSLDNRFTKIGKLSETKHGIYLINNNDLKGVHFSYHVDGTKHLTTGVGNHIQFKTVKSSCIKTITSFESVGCFGIELESLVWINEDSVKKNSIVLKCETNARIDVGVVLKLFLGSSTKQKEFQERIKSKGETCKDVQQSFISSQHKNLQILVQLQYHVAV